MGGRIEQRCMQRRRWRELPEGIVEARVDRRGLQTVLRGCRSVPKHHVLQQRVVQPLQHRVQGKEGGQQRDLDSIK